MQSDIRIACLQRRPFRKRLLDAAFAEVALPGRDQFLDLLGCAALADGDQLDLRRIATREFRRGRNAVEDLPAAVCGVAHPRAIESAMKRRQTSIPRRWLIADTRLGDQLWESVARLPRGSGVLVLFHELSTNARERVIRRLRHVAVGKGLTLIDEAQGAARVHDPRELRRALLQRTPLILLSPIYPTQSHPGLRAIPRMRAAAYAHLTGRRLIALGGMDPQRFRRIERLGFIGWAGISAWLRI